jgi:phosphatidylserine/phosphatidylglycerophosphate/cardiolipin synthase-like enzyme
MRLLLVFSLLCVGAWANVPAVCFSPDGGCDEKLWTFFQSAKKSLDVAVFDLTHEKIVHEILVASRRVPVRVVVDRRQSKGPHSLVSTLVKAKVPVRFGRQRGVMHHKFAIVDGVTLQTGSFNYTDSATRRNRENQLYLADPAIVGAYRKEFDRLWDEGAPADAPSKSNRRTASRRER